GAAAPVLAAPVLAVSVVAPVLAGAAAPVLVAPVLAAPVVAPVLAVGAAAPVLPVPAVAPGAARMVGRRCRRTSLATSFALARTPRIRPMPCRPSRNTTIVFSTPPLGARKRFTSCGPVP